MNAGSTVFAPLMAHAPHKETQKHATRCGGDRYLNRFSRWDQSLARAFAQLTYRESLRDIETCLHSLRGKRYPMGLRAAVARSTLADANEYRDWGIFADFARALSGLQPPAR
jgi:hypothetical protein